LSDFFPHGEIAQRYGVLRPDGRSERALFIVDKSGMIRYVDVHDIDDQPDNEELFRALAEIEPEAAAALEAAKPASELEPDFGVVMYCTPWCPSCRLARLYLQDCGVEYVEVDISRDRAAAQRVREWANGNETTPTFNIRGTIVVGYDRIRLEQAINDPS
jgi:glutaredoxin